MLLLRFNQEYTSKLRVSCFVCFVSIFLAFSSRNYFSVRDFSHSVSFYVSVTDWTVKGCKIHKGDIFSIRVAGSVLQFFLKMSLTLVFLNFKNFSD